MAFADEKPAKALRFLRIIRNFAPAMYKKRSYCATIGFFDGVHRGHRQVIERVKQTAAAKGLGTMAITFDNHPMEIVRPGYVPELLITSDEKEEKLIALGVDKVVMLHFTHEMMQQPARLFMEKTLRDELGVKILVMGYDNRFGKRNHEETFETYVEYGQELGIEVIEGPRPEECGLFEGNPVSSSLIRELIKEGRQKDAQELLL